MKVGVLDYGVGNLGSVVRALEELRASPVLVTRAIDVAPADVLILPGVGNFADCARLLRSGGWIEAVLEAVVTRDKPLLGVCVGMQLLATRSDEGAGDSANDVEGFGLIPGRVRHLRDLGCNMRVPHVGWNDVRVVCSHSRSIFDGIADGTDFYFVHSYAFEVQDSNDVLAVTDYGAPVTAAVRRGRVWGTQFHPEKSSRAGFRLLRNFINGVAC